MEYVYAYEIKQQNTNETSWLCTIFCADNDDYHCIFSYSDNAKHIYGYTNKC